MSELHPHHENHPDVISRNARYGLFLFVIYVILFCGFLLLNILAPEVMAKTALLLFSDWQLSLGGANLAVVYGMGLILAAFVLAIIYMRLTKQKQQ